MNRLCSPMRLAVGILTLTIAGCAIDPSKFTKPGAQPGDFENAYYECQVRESNSLGATMYMQNPGGNMFYPSVMAPHGIRLCLEEKGWVEGEQKKTDTATGQSQPREQIAVEAPPPAVPGGKLGIVPKEITPTIANLLKMDEVGGVFVAAVYTNSVASRAGIKKGDVIIKYSDKVLTTDLEQFQSAIAATPPGGTVIITVWRNRSEITLSVQF